MLRELQRKLLENILAYQVDNFALYERVLAQRLKNKNKIYLLHEPDVYCVGKGKDHKQYEYGTNSSIVATKNSQVIVGVKSHAKHEHDSKTLNSAITVACEFRSKEIKMAVVDRGYRGAKQYVDYEVLLPSTPLKRDTSYQRQKKRILCRERTAIEPISRTLET